MQASESKVKETLFKTWKEEDKLSYDRKGLRTNFFAFSRKFIEQLRAQALFGKHLSLESVPAKLYEVPFVVTASWVPPIPAGSALILSPALVERLTSKEIDRYYDLVEAHRVQNVRIFLLLLSCLSPSSRDVLESQTSWKAILATTDDWVAVYNIIVKTHVIEIGGTTAEAKLLLVKSVTAEILNFKQLVSHTTFQHFERFLDLIKKEGKC